MSIQRTLIIVFGFLVVILAAYIGYNFLGSNLATQQKSAEQLVDPADVYFDIEFSTSPSSVELVKNEGLEMALILASVPESVAAIELALSYDPTGLTVEYVESGDLFDIYINKQVDDGRGLVNLSAAGRTYPEQLGKNLVFLNIFKLVDTPVELKIDGFNLEKQKGDRMSSIVIDSQEKYLPEQIIIIN